MRAPAVPSHCCLHKTPPVTGSRWCSGCRYASPYPQELAAHPLKLGLSMSVAVDTTDRSGAVAMTTVAHRPDYSTDVFKHELEQADQLVARIVAASSGGAGSTLAQVN